LFKARIILKRLLSCYNSSSAIKNLVTIWCAKPLQGIENFYNESKITISAQLYLKVLWKSRFCSNQRNVSGRWYWTYWDETRIVTTSSNNNFNTFIK
jgi:hypothetical protein